MTGTSSAAREGHGAPPARRTLIAVLSLLGATLFWAGNYIVGARVVEEVGPLSLVWWRWVLALVPLLVIAQLVERPAWSRVWRHWRWLLLSSMTGVLAYTVLLYAALEHTTAFNASLINAVNPALITLAAALFLRERLTPLAVVGVLVALVGVLIVLTGGDLSRVLVTGFGTGELLMIVAVCVWTTYTLIARASPPVPPITSTAVQAVMAVVVLTPVVLLTGGPSALGDRGTVLSVLFIAIFPTVLAYLLWNRALTVVPAGVAGVSMNLITVFTALFTILVGDPYTAAQVIGGLIVIAGVVVTNAQALRPRPRRAAP